MDACREILEKAHELPFLQLVRKKDGGGTEGTGPHRVKLISDKVNQRKNFKTKELEYVVDLEIEEDGVKKIYFFSVKNEADEVHYLVKKLAQFNPGDEVVMEYKREGMTGFIDVVLTSEGKKEPPEGW